MKPTRGSVPDNHEISGRPPKRNWLRKFRDAFAGLHYGMRGQSSFAIHAIAAVVVLATAAFFQCDWISFCILWLCIGTVFVAELFNSALEKLAAGVCREFNSDVGQALDIASAAVLLASGIAAIIGFIVLGRSFLLWFHAF